MVSQSLTRPRDSTKPEERAEDREEHRRHG
jgi:hypothetical protein